MFQRMANGWELAKEGIQVIRMDKQLLLFPLLSGIACLLVLASFLLPLWGLGVIEQVLAGDGAEATLNDPLAYAGMFLYYWVNYFVIIFFNSALVACAVLRFRGEDPTLRDGLNASLNRLPQILGWSLVSATVGVILRAIESRSEKAGQIAAALLGTGWAIATYFVVPVIVIEKASPIEGFKRSISIMKHTWGEALGANFGVGFIMFLFSLPGFALIVGGITLFGQAVAVAAALVVLGVIWLLVASLVSTALDAVILAGLYLYAADGTVPQAFDGRMLEEAFAR